MSRERIALLPACLCGVLVLSGCDSGQLPNDSTLSITPSERSYVITERRDANGGCLFDVGSFTDVPIVLTLRDGSGSPLGDVQVSVYVDFAANTFAGTAPLALYEDRNGNGIVDADSELVSAEEDDIARVRLDKYSGSRAMLLRVNVSCAYRSEIFAYANDVSTSATIEVATRDVDSPDPVPEQETDESGADTTP